MKLFTTFLFIDNKKNIIDTLIRINIKGGIKLINKLIKETRSFRRFTRDKITTKEFENVIELARFSGSARNAQCIRYILITEDEMCNKIFSYTKWAGYIDWNPSIEDSPTGYILMLNDKSIGIPENLFHFDMGIASQNIMLKLRDMKYGGCLIGAYNKSKIREILDISSDYDMGILIAIGKPNEKVEIVDSENEIKYFRKNEIHYVPKLKRDKLILKKYY
jgi:nitroreductase